MSAEEEIYNEVKSSLLRQYYSGELTEEEYESKLAELRKRRYGELDAGGGLFSGRSIWTDLDLPPEKFDLYAPLTGIGIGTFMLIMALFWQLHLDSPILRGGRGEGFMVPWFLVIIGVITIVCCIPCLTEWRRKKREGLYELHQERYWQNHDKED